MRQSFIRSLAPAAAAAALVLGAAQPAVAADTYKVNLRPLNQSGVTGIGSLTLNDERTQLTVKISASGLEKNQLHIAHIHGLVVGGEPVDSAIPSRAQDSDSDKFVELLEGAVTYGPILVTLATDTGGNIDPDGDGTVDYEQTFDLTNPAVFSGTFNVNSLLGEGQALELREIIVHGMTVPPGPGEGTGGEVDGANGYLVVLPVAGGEIGKVGDPFRFRPSPRGQ